MCNCTAKYHGWQSEMDIRRDYRIEKYSKLDDLVPSKYGNISLVLLIFTHLYGNIIIGQVDFQIVVKYTKGSIVGIGYKGIKHQEPTLIHTDPQFSY